MKEVSENLPEQLEYAVGQCKVALDRMCKLVVSEGFLDQKSEIYFFKKIKPAVYSKLLKSQIIYIKLKNNEQGRFSLWAGLCLPFL
jgi:hypothetical protein